MKTNFSMEKWEKLAHMKICAMWMYDQMDCSNQVGWKYLYSSEESEEWN